jgi:phage terminase Nu1 subunit (DNA packaging protein)
VQKLDRTVAPEIASAWPSAGVVEPFVSRHELARLMGVSIDTVDRLVAEGMPSVTWGRRKRRFRPAVAIGWASDRVRSA